MMEKNVHPDKTKSTFSNREATGKYSGVRGSFLKKYGNFYNIHRYRKEVCFECSFSYFLTKKYVAGTHWNRLDEALPMITTKI